MFEMRPGLPTRPAGDSRPAAEYAIKVIHPGESRGRAGARCQVSGRGEAVAVAAPAAEDQSLSDVCGVGGYEW